jgi:hypothetical protein
MGRWTRGWVLFAVALLWCGCSGSSDGSKDLATATDVQDGGKELVQDVQAELALADLVPLDTVELLSDAASELPLEDVVEEVAAEVTDTVEIDPGVLTGQWVQLSTAHLGEHVLKSIWGFDDGNVVTVGEAGLVAALVKDSFAPSFQDPSLNILNGVWGSSATDIWTVGMYGLIYHYDGATWSMPKYCTTVAECSFSGECLFAQCLDNECVYSPTGNKDCCGAENYANHLDTGMEQMELQVEDLYAGSPDGGIVWQVASLVGPDGKPRFQTPPNALYFGDATKTCPADPETLCPDFSNGKPVGATVSTGTVTIPDTAENAILSFYLRIDVEASPSVDEFLVRVLNSGKWEEVWSKTALAGNFPDSFVQVKVDVSKYIGKAVKFQFHFDSVTATNNALEGIYVDDIQLSTTCSIAGALAGKFPTLWSVWGASDDHVFAVGSGGKVVHFNGVNWETQSSGEIYAPLSIHGATATDAMLVGRAGLALHSTGGDWQTEDTNTPMDMVHVWGTSAERYIAVGDDGFINVYSSGNWSPVFGATSVDLNDLIGFADDDYYLVGNDATILHFDGFNFTSIPNLGFTFTDYQAIWGESAEFVTVVGEKAVMSGTPGNLVKEVVPVETLWRAVWGTGDYRYVAGDFGKVMQFDGENWSNMVTKVEKPLLGIWGFGPDDVFAVGEESTVIHWDGEEWETMVAPGGEDVDFIEVWGTGPDDVYIVADLPEADEPFGFLLHYDGSSWRIALAGTAADLRHVHGTAWNDAYAVGQGATIIHYEGKGWGVQFIDPYEVEGQDPYFVTSTLYGVYARTKDDVWAVGDGGHVVRYDGESWKLSSVEGSTLRAVWAHSEENIWAVGAAGTILHYNGTQWMPEPSGTVATLYAIWGDTYGNIYAVGDNGTILQFVAD